MTKPVRVEPMDKYNEMLVANVHPPDWANPTPADRYNMVVIGAGTAGLVTAAGAAGLGAKVAIVEKHLLGGDCLNYGCVPSKSVIRSSRVVRDIADAARYGIVAAPAEIDFAAVMERMRRIRASISEHDSLEKFRKLGVDIFLGEGKFTSTDTVAVGDKTLRFARACIATGARAYQPDIEGLGDAGFLTNETVFSLTERPARLAVLGGGPLGCELAQTFARLGCEVTIIEMTDHLLSREDPDAAAILTSALKRDGIEVMLNSRVVKVSTEQTGKCLHMQVDGSEAKTEVDEILVGAGREPNVENLGLEAAGIAYDPRKGVTIDDHLRTTNKHVFAAGDVCLKYKFTHTADATARIVIQNALFWGRKKLSALTIPWCTYTDPEIAHVGISERDAREQGIEIDTYIEKLSDVDRAICDGETEGFVKVHVRRNKDKILGATIVARHAGEMISELTVAMVGGVGLGGLGSVIHPYPTQAEAIKHVSDAYNRTRLTPALRQLFGKLMEWKR